MLLAIGTGNDKQVLVEINKDVPNALSLNNKKKSQMKNLFV
jgi:hypothetical protein